MIIATASSRPAGRTRRSRSSRGARAGVFAALLLAVAVVSLASVLIGSNRLAPDAVLHGLLHPGSGTDATVVYGSRVPRTVIGLLVGVCLGVAGTVMQGHTRNPLADPGLFGVSAGAGLAVVLGIVVLGVSGTGASVGLALIGALLASVTAFAITIAGSGTANPVPLAIAGTAVSALLGAVTSFLTLADRESLRAYTLWVVGSLSGRQLDDVHGTVPFAVAGLVLAALNTRALDNLALGEELARGLGENLLLARAVGLGAITLLTAAATAAAGPIAFVGLVVPHLARALVGSGHRRLLPAAALVGCLLVLCADVVGRVVAGYAEVQVGIVMAVIGGPFFVAVARRRSLVSL
ncbi:iron ABC transporter permease [Streptomyces sp. CRN 30]|uniref:FecCD family ABC transporter permease n=1 Tax=Streptomyces sp. CRN 30 TaxID=3075613 RepID=UPI002A823421|nr:iron ABC transporter permease [Streptomyces sp. CRN 30]